MTNASLLYIHGFLSSPLSHKAQATKSWLASNYPQVLFYAPQLSPYPKDVGRLLSALVEKIETPVYLMGSSLGGFWATFLAEQYNLPAIVINPACKPQRLLPRYVGQEIQNYHSEETYRLTSAHVEELETFDVPINRPENYWLMAQTKDETLDYREAAEKYHAAKQLIEDGGNHSFEGFENHLPDCLRFFESFSQKHP